MDNDHDYIDHQDDANNYDDPPDIGLVFFLYILKTKMFMYLHRR